MWMEHRKDKEKWNVKPDGSLKVQCGDEQRRTSLIQWTECFPALGICFNIMYIFKNRLAL